MSAHKALNGLGGWVRGQIGGIGYFTRFLGALLARSGIAVRRPGLVSQQVHFIGNYSLLIIAVSGLFVGFVLGLQGYYTSTATVPKRRWACWWRCRWSASWGRWSRRCCSPAAPAPR